VIKKHSHIVFIGIGGIGMSALARNFLHQNIPVFGFDRTKTALTEALEKEGAILCYTEDVTTYPGWPEAETTVIYTPAIASTHPWRLFFETYKPIKRAAALGQLTKGYKTLAVAGTHGKTSTSAILTHLLTLAGLDPTAFIGGILSASGTNYRLGNGPWMIVEADEFDRSFLHLHPTAAAITTADADHLDIYDDETDLNNTFNAFIQQVDGPTFTGTSLKKTTAVGSTGNYSFATNIQANQGAYSFTLHLGNDHLDTKLYMPGKHNVYNAVLAAALAHHAGVSLEHIAAALPTFGGIQRRFEYHLKGDTTLIEDYAHHPTELKALIDSLDEMYPEKNILLCFQPHLYSRTRDFFDGFVTQLKRVHRCILLPIYAARERPIEGIHSTALAAQIPGAKTCNLAGLPEAVRTEKHDVVLIVGAGDIGDTIPLLKAALR
jgi:UDP-N-acetylmuramate--alanine ligase